MEVAGPAAILSFIVAAFINWTVAMALGELACAHPAAGSFGVYGDLYLNPFAGFIARAGYWVGLALAIGAEMIAAATYMSSWFPGVRPFLWIIVFGFLLLAINLRNVGSYGRVEFWLSMIKLATIVAFILIGAVLLVGGRVTPQYNAQGGFFPKGLWSPLIAMTFAVYSFGGVEMVAVTTGESLSPKETPRAVWLTFLSLTFVYVGAIVILLGVMPWNHAGVTESPFVTTFRTVKIPRASGVMNFVVLTAALSGANATLYVASRMIFSLARTGWAPARLGRLNHEGSPQYAVLISVLRNFLRARSRPLGAAERLPLHGRSRLHRNDSFLARFPGCPHQLPPPPLPRTTRRAPFALPAWNLGIHSRIHPCFHRFGSNLALSSRQPVERPRLPGGFDLRLPPPQDRSEKEYLPVEAVPIVNDSVDSKSGRSLSRSSVRLSLLCCNPRAPAYNLHDFPMS